MFGVSVKVWGMEKEGEEFSVIITHNSSVKDFLVVFFDLLETDFLVDKKTMEDVKDVSTTYLPSMEKCKN